MVLFFQRGTAFPKKKGKLEAFEKKWAAKLKSNNFTKQELQNSTEIYLIKQDETLWSIFRQRLNRDKFLASTIFYEIETWRKLKQYKNRWDTLTTM